MNPAKVHVFLTETKSIVIPDSVLLSSYCQEMFNHKAKSQLSVESNIKKQFQMQVTERTPKGDILANVIHSVHPPRFCKLLSNYQKWGGLDRILIFRGGCWERGGNLFQGEGERRVGFSLK